LSLAPRTSVLGARAPLLHITLMHLSIPQILADRSKAKKWKGEPFSQAEEKLDGYRMTLVFDDRGVASMFGRRLTHDYWWAVSRCLSPEDLSNISGSGLKSAIIDGEIVVPDIGSSSNAISHAIAQGLRLVFRPWSFLRFEDRDTSTWTFNDQDESLRSVGFNPVGRMSRTEFERLDARQEAQTRSIEGWILKQSPLFGWFKVKWTESVDAFITQVLPGTGRLSDSMGSLVVAVLNDDLSIQEIANVGSGFSDEQRRLLWENRADLIGQVVEVHYDSIQQNRLRFPIFAHFRDDRVYSDCHAEQLR